MATQDLGFNVFALDKASRTFIRLSERIERVSDKLDELDRKRANPQIDLDVDEDKVRSAVGTFAKTAEGEAERRKRGFFAAMFTPNRSIVMALRTGIPAVLGSPIGAAALVLAGVFVTSFAAAVLASGVFAAVGGGFTAIAAVVLKENKRLQASFTDLAGTAKTGLMQAANPLVPTFEKALSQVQRMFGPHIREPLERIFAGLEPTIVPFAESAVRTVGNILDSLSTPEFLTGMQTVLGSISRELPRLGDQIGGFFVDLAKNADDIAEAFGNVVTVMGGLLDFAAGAVNKFTDLFNLMSDVASLEFKNLPGPWFSPDDQESARSTLQVIKDLNDLVLGFTPLEDPIGDAFMESTEKAAGMTAKFESEIRGLQNRVPEVSTNLEQMAEAEEKLSDEIERVNGALDAERDKLDELKDSLFASAEGVLGLREAQVAYEEQLDTTRKTLEENGRSLDINTEKGQENRRAIDDQAEAALQQIEAMIEQGRSTDQVSKFTQQAREDFIDAAEAAGMEEGAAKRLADQLGLVPDEVVTHMKAIDEMSGTINSLKRQIRELQRMAGVIPIGTSVGAFFGSSLVVPRGHDGGMITPTGIRRMHSGGALGPDERHIIGLTGERILNREEAAAYNAGAASRGSDGASALGGSPAELTGNLFLDSGEFLGVIRGQVSESISEHDRTIKSRVRAGSGRAR